MAAKSSRKKLTTISISLPADLVAKLDKAVDRYRYKVSRSSCVEVAIAEWLKGRK